MKFNIVLSSVAVALSCFAGYLAFSIAEGKSGDAVCGIASTVCFVATTVPLIGVQYEMVRTGVNVKVLSFLFLVVFLVSHFAFAAICIKMPYYVIVNGILLLVYAALIYKMQQIKEL